VLKLADARRTAEEKGLDLILIVPNANPPIAKVMSFDKFRYQREKELKKQRADAKAPEMKQIQISYREATNDLLMKVGRLQKFIEEKHKVGVVMRLRGREKGMKDMTRKKMEEFLKLITFPHKISQPIKFEGNGYSVYIEAK